LVSLVSFSFFFSFLSPPSPVRTCSLLGLALSGPSLTSFPSTVEGSSQMTEDRSREAAFLVSRITSFGSGTVVIPSPSVSPQPGSPVPSAPKKKAKEAEKGKMMEISLALSPPPPIEEVFVPPLNFAMVAPGVYRSGYPNKKNFPFLKKLKLKSIM